MPHELIYTSVQKGLKPGTHGFCTVATTPEIPRNLAERLESLSGYRHVFGFQDPNAHLNPEVLAHLVFSVSRVKYHVLSRVADAGLDYTKRSNKLAHHVALQQGEIAALSAGPAWLLAQPACLERQWEGDARILPANRALPGGSCDPSICSAWQQLTGDAGWGGALAESAVNGAKRQAVIVFKPGMSVLPLAVEALGLLKPSERWNVTFNTYFTKLPPGIDCQWRFVLEGTTEAKTARRLPNALIIDLCNPLAPAQGDVLVEAARTGVVPERTAPTTPTQVGLVTTPVLEEEADLRQDKMPAPSVPEQAADVGLTRLPGVRRAKKKSKAPMIATAVGVVALLIVGAVAAITVFSEPEPLVLPPVVTPKDDGPSEQELAEERALTAIDAKIEQANGITERAGKAKGTARSFQNAVTEGMKKADAESKAIEKSKVFEKARGEEQKRKALDLLKKKRDQIKQNLDQLMVAFDAAKNETDGITKELKTLDQEVTTSLSDVKTLAVNARKKDLQRVLGSANSTTDEATAMLVAASKQLAAGHGHLKSVNRFIQTREDKLPKVVSVDPKDFGPVKAPFRDLPRSFSVAQPQLSGGTASQALGVLHIKHPSQCRLTLFGDVHGDETAFVTSTAPEMGRWNVFLTSVERDEKGNVKRAPDGSVVLKEVGLKVQRDIGTFFLAEAERGYQLNFAWKRGAGRNDKDMQFINCGVGLQVGKDQRLLSMRPPTEPKEPLRVNICSDKSFYQEFVIDAFPKHAQDLGLELRLEGFPANEFSHDGFSQHVVKERVEVGEGDSKEQYVSLAETEIESSLVTKGANARMEVRFVKPASESPTESRGSLKVDMTFWGDKRKIPAMHGVPDVFGDGEGISPRALQRAENGFNKLLDDKKKSLANAEKRYGAELANLNKKKPGPKAPDKHKKEWNGKKKQLDSWIGAERNEATKYIRKWTPLRDYAVHVRKMAEQIEQHGKMHVRIFAVYPGYEVDLVKFTAIPRGQ